MPKGAAIGLLLLLAACNPAPPPEKPRPSQKPPLILPPNHPTEVHQMKRSRLLREGRWASARGFAASNSAEECLSWASVYLRVAEKPAYGGEAEWLYLLWHSRKSS